jgi:hypothetical protein
VTEESDSSAASQASINAGEVDASPSNQDNSTLVLDVHAPHEAAHTWADFFIHIATIVVGLLIAIALEQTVEFFHHRQEVAETRAAAAAEGRLVYRRAY